MWFRVKALLMLELIWYLIVGRNKKIQGCHLLCCSISDRDGGRAWNITFPTLVVLTLPRPKTLIIGNVGFDDYLELVLTRDKNSHLISDGCT